MPTSAPGSDCSSAVRPARPIALVLVALTLASFWALTVSGLPTLAKAGLVPLVAFYGLRSAWQSLHPPIHRMRWDGQSLVLQGSDGQWSRFDRRGRAFVCPVFIAVVLGSDSGKRLSLGIFRSQIDADFWRQTMIRIRASAVDRPG
jgi:hypothetical protein